jgi:FlaG/FlaF family flagellin (archaellin)
MNGTRGNDSAVSPVVGVMLMLVVTIIIASVISAYAGGLSGTREKAPQVSIAVKAYNNSTIYFDHMGGDGFSIDDLTIILDQGDKSIRLSKATISDKENLTNKARPDFIRPGDTIMLVGGIEGSASNITNFTTASTYIRIAHNREFTWTLLSQRSDAIMARGTLAFI